MGDLDSSPALPLPGLEKVGTISPFDLSFLLYEMRSSPKISIAMRLAENIRKKVTL